MKTLSRICLALAGIILSATLALAHGYKLGDLDIHHPYSKAMIPNAQVGGGFMTITNNGTSDDRLVSVTTSVAGMVQIHEMKMEGDVMKMAELKDGLPIPAGQKVELKPGGFHIMFMDVKHAFKEGDVVKATLTFEKAGSIEVEFKVGPANPDQMGHDDHAKADHNAHHQHAATADIEQPADPMAAIPLVMKALFETEGNPLAVEPVIVSGDWALAGWIQGEKGGRALMKKGDKGWAIHLCSGASLKDQATLEQIGIPTAEAKTIAEQNAAAEAALGADKIALFDSFEGTMMMHGG